MKSERSWAGIICGFVLFIVVLIYMKIVVIVASRDLIVLPRKPHSSTKNYNHFNLIHDSFNKIPILSVKSKEICLLFRMIII